jgi:CBS domain-containing protein
MTTAKQILQGKGYDVWSVPPETTILSALEMMAKHNAGALMVMQGGRLVGVFSERDYARRGILQGRGPDTPVQELMTPMVYYVTPEQTTEEIMSLMRDKKIRHLPVISNEQVQGVISIGDVVNTLIQEQKETIHGLENYILGGEFAREPRK